MRYFVCTACNRWSKEPEGFDERKHFGKCPNCDRSMYLVHGTPKEDGYNERWEVKAGLMRHGEKM